MSSPPPDRDALLLEFLDQVPFDPYPVQEEALVRYFESAEGVLVCAPTGMGKTLIAEAAMYEALRTGRRAYYTTPLIALSEQKFAEMQAAAERWGFSRHDVGLVTGNRSVNPQATVLVVVAEILLNRLLHREALDFRDVAAVVMDEFHTFNDPERGIVWELTLSMLPAHVRLLLLSATVGNGSDFLSWLRTRHGRDLTLVQGRDRHVPLHFHWIGDRLLPELLAEMVEAAHTPALVFCFDRQRCWSVGELLRGRDFLRGDQQARLAERIEAFDFSRGAGPKLKRILLRGVGIHHAGLLPGYRQAVETLFQEKLLSICVCTETLAAGMNLPARSVVLTSLLKGPKGKKKLIPSATAHQMFGRAGRPQFDTEGHVYAIAHEDDVKILRHKEKIAQIPEETRDPQLMKMRKRLVKKTPKRREGEAYWSEEQFEKLQAAEPGKLASRGALPWRLLAFLLETHSEVRALREVVARRFMSEAERARGQKTLTRMLTTLHEEGYVRLTPAPPPPPSERPAASPGPPAPESAASEPAAGARALADGLALGGAPTGRPAPAPGNTAGGGGAGAGGDACAGAETETAGPEAAYEPETAAATPALKPLLAFRAAPPLYAAFLLDYLGLADEAERLQLFESLLEMPGSVARRVRVPFPQELEPGALTREIVDPALLTRGLASYETLYPPLPHEQERPFGEAPQFPVPLAEKMRLLFENKVRHGGPVPITPVWAAGDLLEFGGDWQAFVTARDLTPQEGIVFRHVLRLVLLLREFASVAPEGVTATTWQAELGALGERLAASCRAVDPASTDEVIARGA